MENPRTDSASLIEALPSSMMLVRPALALALSEGGHAADPRRVIAECAAEGGLEARARTVSGRAELALLAYAATGIGDAETAGRIYELLLSRRGQVAAWAGWAFWGAVDGVLGVSPRPADDRTVRSSTSRPRWRCTTGPGGGLSRR